MFPDSISCYWSDNRFLPWSLKCNPKTLYLNPTHPKYDSTQCEYYLLRHWWRREEKEWPSVTRSERQKLWIILTIVMVMFGQIPVTLPGKSFFTEYGRWRHTETLRRKLNYCDGDLVVVIWEYPRSILSPPTPRTCSPKSLVLEILTLLCVLFYRRLLQIPFKMNPVNGNLLSFYIKFFL